MYFYEDKGREIIKCGKVFFGGVWEMENWNMHSKHFRGSWFFLFFFLLPVWVRASQKKKVFPLSYLCGWEVDEAGQVFSLRSGKIFLLLEPALQLVNLNIMYLQRMFLNILILNLNIFIVSENERFSYSGQADGLWKNDIWCYQKELNWFLMW